MNDTWKNIETRLAELGWDDLLADLQGPAPQSELDALREEVGEKPPTQLITYLAIHNGSAGRYRLIEPWELLPVDAIIEKIRFIHGDFRNLLHAEDIALDDEQEARGPVKPVIWNDHWWPFADDGSGNLLCVDDDPADGGTKGQVIFWSADPPYVEVTAKTLDEFFEQYDKDLADGNYDFSEFDGVSKKEQR